MRDKTIAHYLTDLRLDLKDAGTLWTDGELTRCIEKAVADLSRFLPDERQLEITVDAEVDDESFTTPTATDTDYFVTTYDISAVSDGATATLAARRPDVPRPVRIAVTDANTSITQLVVIVKGQDVDNRYIEEYFYLEGGLIQTGKKYFALVTAVEIDEIAGNGAADTMIVGTGSHLGVYVQLAYKPIKFHSDAITSRTRDKDYEMDYIGGRIAIITGTAMAANTAYTLDYTKSRLDIDLSTLVTDIIKIERVEYPTGSVPQKFHSYEVWGKTLTFTGDTETQEEVTDEEHAIVRYLASHSPPDAQSPGSFLRHLDTTVQLAASAYALFIKALQYEHQAVTDNASARTDLASAATQLGLISYTNVTSTHTLAKTALDKAAVLVTAATGKIDLALTKVALYLETNGTTDNAKEILADITDNIADLRTAIETAVDAAVTNLGLVFTSSIDKATTGGEGLLDSGDNFIDTVNDGVRVPENYREYAQARSDLAISRVQAVIAYLQEAATRLSNLRSYIEESAGWRQMGETFIAEATAWINEANAEVNEAMGRVNQIDRYLAQMQQYIDAARVYEQSALQYEQISRGNVELANSFKAEAIERRNEAWAIWSSPNQIAANYTLGQRSQTPQ